MFKADAYAYRDRRNRKRDFRRLWITRINAAARAEGMSLRDVHPRPAAGRRRAGPQGPGRHRRARPRDLPPIRRARPRGLGGLAQPRTPPSLQGRPSDPERRPFLFPMTRNHQPPQRSAQRDPQARRQALARQAGRVRGRGRGPARGRRRRRLARRRALRRRRAAGSNGIPVRAARAGRRSPSSGSGTRAIGVYPQRWSAPVGPLLRRAVGRRRPGQRRHGHPLRAGVRRGSVALGPGSADPYGHKAVRASMGALFSVPVARVQERRRAARPPRRARRPRGRAAERAAVDGDCTLVVGAEREGLPDARRRRVRRRRPHPDRPRRLPQRRHGGDRRPLRAHD